MHSDAVMLQMHKAFDKSLWCSGRFTVSASRLSCGRRFTTCHGHFFVLGVVIPSACLVSQNVRFFGEFRLHYLRANTDRDREHGNTIMMITGYIQRAYKPRREYHSKGLRSLAVATKVSNVIP